MVLSKDFREFIELLNERRVKYLVIGGYAVTFHGYPRYTKDIDFWIWLDDENLSHLEKVLSDFGLGSIGLTKEHFKNPDDVIQLGYEPNRIDILVALEGLNFEESFGNKSIKEIDGIDVNFIGIDDLIKAKKIAGRLKDLADVETLEKIKNNKS